MTTDQMVVKPQPFEWYDPGHQEAIEVLSPMFDGIILKITGVDVSYGTPDENPINNVELTAGSVSGWTVDIQSPGLAKTLGPTFGGQHITVRTGIRLRSLMIRMSG